MTGLPKKVMILAALRERIESDLAAIAESQRKTQEGATHEEAKPEGDKDTRATESSYLARGLAKRVSELRNAAGKLATMLLRSFTDDDAIELGALISLEDDEGELFHYFLAPAGGGIKLLVANVEIRVITPAAPVGAALLGKEVGDDVQLRTPGGTRSLTVEAIV